MKYGQGPPPSGGWKALMPGDGSDPDYSPAYQDEYQRLWHEAAARAEAAEALAERRGAALEQAIEDLEVIRADFPGTLRALEIEGNVKHYRAALADGGHA